MKVEKNTYTEEDLSQYDHFSSNLKTPLEVMLLIYRIKKKSKLSKKRLQI